jgi:hypothetical protein
MPVMRNVASGNQLSKSLLFSRNAANSHHATHTDLSRLDHKASQTAHSGDNSPLSRDDHLDSQDEDNDSLLADSRQHSANDCNALRNVASQISLMASPSAAKHHITLSANSITATTTSSLPNLAHNALGHQSTLSARPLLNQFNCDSPQQIHIKTNGSIHSFRENKRLLLN